MTIYLGPLTIESISLTSLAPSFPEKNTINIIMQYLQKYVLWIRPLSVCICCICVPQIARFGNMSNCLPQNRLCVRTFLKLSRPHRNSWVPKRVTRHLVRFHELPLLSVTKPLTNSKYFNLKLLGIWKEFLRKSPYWNLLLWNPAQNMHAEEQGAHPSHPLRLRPRHPLLPFGIFVAFASFIPFISFVSSVSSVPRVSFVSFAPSSH